MMKRLLILLCTACQSLPSTTYFADMDTLERSGIRPLCHGITPMSREEIDPSLPERHRQIRQLRCSLRMPGGAFTGPLPFTLRGSSSGKAGEVCGIQIGPAPIWAPFPLEVALAWFKDAALANKLHDAVGQVDYSRAYKVSVTSEGFHVHMEQFAFFGGPYIEPMMELVIDGCGRFPSNERVFTAGEALVFRDQRVPRPTRRSPIRARMDSLPPEPEGMFLDTTRAAQLLLRNAVRAPPQVACLERETALAKQATQVMDTLQEIGALSSLVPIEWRKIIPELAAALSASEDLLFMLRKAGFSEFDGEIAADIARIEKIVSPKEWALAEAKKWSSVEPLSPLESMELGELMIAAATRQARAARRVEARDRDKLIATVEPVALHIAMATHVAASLKSRFGSAWVIENLRELSREMTQLAEICLKAPKLDWHIALASAFDAENELRAVAGKEKNDRPYTVSADPAATARPLTTEERSWTDQAPGRAP